ncbi:HsdM family class I SAM-dependent methyltransferase [Staphylococcus pseudintermedius]|uniref:HsdM family class I SAM-dependent methyltransferase n=1 Tax=Staphylococcus pseudintermedius TaxID=283734 RepID=UPI00286DF433|nr:N-6 DNA methylase [Staphylococcus pseudintermedius]WMZ55074.1 N-6 DNA methylase [Staphylococcus pseudintermedius]
MVKSVEPNIADLVNSWLKNYNLDYRLEQESLNFEIDKALNEYASKSGGSGGNRPDVKLILQDENLDFYPILIEYKGYKDKLVKLDTGGKVDNIKANSEPHYKNINSYAVNGAVHYANAILHYTSYTDVIAIGVTGYKDFDDKIKHSIGVYYVSKENLGIGQEVDKYTDLSFLKKQNFNSFIKKVKELSLSTDELENLREKREKEINASLTRLNNDIYNDEKGLSETDRVYLVVSSIIATLGVPGKVRPLEKIDLKSSLEEGERDGDIMIRKINAFLSNKNLPNSKKELIIRNLKNTLLSDNINKLKDGESQLKRVFSKIVDDLGIYYKIGLSTDFTGKLFNEMYSWLGFTQDKLNDVVLTPPYVAKLLVKLARVDMNSYVWDFATGSAGLLVAAMNEMLDDAKEKIKSPEEYNIKVSKIKGEQLLGLEVLSNIYMLAILNMILMGDGSSNILNQDSLRDFDGKYAFGKEDEKFPENAFVLNPPYSVEGNGMIFVEKALSMMEKGYASVIIQSSAGSGKAKDINKRILQNNTLLASIKMPMDIFIGKSSVQTNIYVFKVGEAHLKDELVKFIDFSEDGYTRSNRKKSSGNLKDSNNAKERYKELVDVVRFGRNKLDLISEEHYFEANIDPESGSDWNKSKPIDTIPKLSDFNTSIGNYLIWEVSTLIRQSMEEDVFLGK